MYLIIYENFDVSKTNHVSAAHFAECDAGILTIINTELMLEYYNGDWHEIQAD